MAMKSDDIKGKMIEAIPYVAVFGIAALAVYGITKIVQSIDDMDIPLDWGQDPYLTKLSKKYHED
jgi:purine nucleoside permease